MSCIVFVGSEHYNISKRSVIYVNKRLKLALCAFLLVCLLADKGAEAAPSGEIAREPIAPGVVQTMYQWPTSRGNARVAMWTCDLNNPNLDIRLIAGQGSYTKRATVAQMISRTGAVAMVNGDYFNMALQGSPIGPSIVDGRLQSSPAVIVGLNALGIDRNGVAHIEPMIFQGKVTANNGSTFPIDGLNKTYYWHDPSGQESHTDTIQMYNDFWTSASRGHQTNSEALVNSQGVVEKISYGKTLPYAVPKGKTILQFNGAALNWVKANVREGSILKIDANMSPDRGWKFLVGGHALVVANGQVQPYTKDVNVLGGVRARTAVGISQDGKTMYIIAAEGRTSRSVGLTLQGIGEFLKQAGAYTAMNLDGGGSTTLITTPLGTSAREVSISPEGFGPQRAVVNGIGVFNTAPKGTLVGVKMAGPSRMIAGESAAFSIRGAWDSNYHPIDGSQIKPVFAVEGNTGVNDGPWVLALEPGKLNVTVSDGERLLGRKEIQVLGAEGIKSLQLEASTFMVQPGSQVQLTVRALTNDGRNIVLSPRVLNWEISGFAGRFEGSGSSLIVDGYNNAPNGIITTRFGDKMATAYLGNTAYRYLDLRIGQQTYWLDGQAMALDVAPIIQKSRTLVPIRLIAEAYQGKVDWNGDSRQVTIEYRGKTLRMILDEPFIEINGQKHAIDVPVRLSKGRTLVPLRVISEALDMQVDYDHTTQTVSIIEKKA